MHPACLGRWLLTLTAAAAFDTTIAGVTVLTEACLGPGFSGLDSNVANADFTYAFGQGALSREISPST